MFDRLRRWLLGALRVPTHPTPPAGSRLIRVFRASPRYYHYKLILWAIAQLGALAGLLFGLVYLPSLVPSWAPRADLIWTIGEVIAWSFFLVQLPFSYAILRLDFELRWYVLSEESLRIRSGVVSIREKTMTFANVQQISVRQNPLQRLLGIADILVRTAGGGDAGESKGAVGEPMHEARFTGVDNVEEIRSAIRDRVRLFRDAGLGDPDEAVLGSGHADHDVLTAARELHGEIRGLRLYLAPSSGIGSGASGETARREAAAASPPPAAPASRVRADGDGRSSRQSLRGG